MQSIVDILTLRKIVRFRRSLFLLPISIVHILVVLSLNATNVQISAIDDET